LSVFNRTDPAGTWSLYVVDDAAGDVGSFSGWSLVFNDLTDDALTGGLTTIKAVHITELQTRVDSIRAAHGLGPYSWGPVMAGVSTIRASHITDLREALRQAYVAAGVTPRTYTDSTLSGGVTVVKAIHILELRQAVLAIE
jgi:hypothetical protein